jgi:PAS domain S-box-containing protein
VPLVLEERVVGTLTLFDKIVPLGTERRLFSIDDLDMLFALSSQIAAEIEDIRLTGRLQELVRSEKQQGEKLRALYSRSQAFLQSISDALLAVDRDGFVEEINAVGRRILGFEDEEVNKLHIDELVEDKPPLREWLDRGGQFSHRVVTLKTATGKVAAMANLQPIMDAETKVTGAVLTFREMGEVGRLVNRVIGVQRTFSFDDIIGQSTVMEKTVELARIAAGTSSNIRIQGETGTGKEVFAQAIHNVSAYSEGPLARQCPRACKRDRTRRRLGAGADDRPWGLASPFAKRVGGREGRRGWGANRLRTSASDLRRSTAPVVLRGIASGGRGCVEGGSTIGHESGDALSSFEAIWVKSRNIKNEIRVSFLICVCKVCFCLELPLFIFWKIQAVSHL